MNADRLMNSMLQSMGMGMPFDMFGDLGFGAPPGHPPQQHQNPMSSLMPHGFMSPMSMMMMDPFQSMQQAMTMASNGTNNGGFSYCSSSVTSYTTDEHGRPQVYQQSNEIKQGPGGVRETKSAVRDSRSGHQELSIGHHLADKAHIKKKSKNVYTGEEEQCEDFVNLEESEAETFERGWRQKANNLSNAHSQLTYGGHPYAGSTRGNRLALTSSAQEDLGHSPSHQRRSPHSARSYVDKIAQKIKKKKKSKEVKI